MDGKTLLLVDDEQHITHLLAHKLKQTGATVITAVDGQEGFNLACDHEPELVVTDFQMPVLNGYDMSVKLRANQMTAHIPLIMLTARGHGLSAEKLAQTNIKHLMSKPFSARDLIAKIGQLILDDSDHEDCAPSGNMEGKAA